jgi:hypothetical protein
MVSAQSAPSATAQPLGLTSGDAAAGMLDRQAVDLLHERPNRTTILVAEEPAHL